MQWRFSSFSSTFGFFFHQLYGTIFLHLDATSKHLCDIVLQMVNNILIVKSVRVAGRPPHSRFLFFQKIDILKALTCTLGEGGGALLALSDKALRLSITCHGFQKARNERCYGGNTSGFQIKIMPQTCKHKNRNTCTVMAKNGGTATVLQY